MSRHRICDETRPEWTGAIQITRRETGGLRSAQQPMLSPALIVHNVLAVKDDAQATRQRELFQAKQRGPRCESRDGDRLELPNGVDVA